MVHMTRRKFLLAASALAVSGTSVLGFPKNSFAMPFKAPLGLQLYTVQQDAERDLPGTLAYIASLGYQEVELPAYSKWSAKELRQAIKDAGLICPSAVFSGDELGNNNLDVCIEYAAEMGANYLVVASPTVEDPGRMIFSDVKDGALLEAYSNFFTHLTLDDWRWNADRLNKIGARAKEAGLQCAYHNHSMEFIRFGDQTAYDLLLSSTDPDLVALELDCGWAQHAGFDPVALLKQHAGRIKLLHLKDVTNQSGPSANLHIKTTEIGSGCINWKDVINVAEATNVEHYFVEQEAPFKLAPLDSIAISYRYLRGLEL